jgi:hypothetical protein
MLGSLVYLLGLYFTRFIPLKFFWGFYWLGERCKIKIGHKILIFLVILCYGLAFLSVFFPLLAVLNLTLAHGFPLVWLPLMTGPKGSADFDPKSLNDRNFSLLLSPLVYSKFTVLPLKFILRFCEYLALVSMGIGAVEISNDFSSHLNPDLLDLFFPADGGVLFFGGFTLFVLAGFFLYFILGARNLRRWKRRLEISAQYSAGYQQLIISPALLHPYFFLSPGAKHFCVKHKIGTKRIALLLEKALIENRDIISLEWLTKKLPRSSLPRRMTGHRD